MPNKAPRIAKKTKTLLAAIATSIEKGIDNIYSQERFIGETMPGEKAALQHWRKAMRRLAYIGYLKETKGGFFVLTAKGKELTKVPPKKTQWDHKWRILIFDIPEQRKKERDALRRCLQRLGFCQLQKSVWAYPFEVPGELDRYLRECRILPYTRYVVATYIDHYRDLLGRFELG